MRMVAVDRFHRSVLCWEAEVEREPTDKCISQVFNPRANARSRARGGSRRDWIDIDDVKDGAKPSLVPPEEWCRSSKGAW